MRRRLAGLVALAVVVVLARFDRSHLSVLPGPPGPRGEPTDEQAAIEKASVCVGSSVTSAGALSNILYYRAVARPDGKIEVGYFAFFSEERPWGNNWLTWSVIPALALDLVYSRALIVFPGLQRALYGAGDIEGVSAVYERTPGGALKLDYAIADDGTHDGVTLTRAQAFSIDRDRPTFYSDVWSHQLGGRGARDRSDLAYVRCYSEGSIRPLPESLARRFHIDHDDRAPPAHVERDGGRRLDVAQTLTALTGPALPHG